MFTQHPTLLIGPSDWDQTRMPKDEFDRRIAALWAAFPDASQAIVFGSASRHAELAYLTNFVPKLEPGIALLVRTGAPKLLFGGGPNMVGAMKPLTFITDMAPLNALAKLIAGWDSPLLIGGGHMASATRKTIAEATSGTIRDATPHVWSMMRRKTPIELAAIREACTILDRAAAAIRNAAQAGAGITTAVLAAERAAIEARAQDVRTLFSRDGGRTLRPFEALDDTRADPLQVYVAVRRFNYWAEGFTRLSNAPDEAGELAKALLRAALATVKGGTGIGVLADAIASGASPFQIHPVTQAAFVSTIGLSLDPPTGDEVFESGEVYSVRVGLTADAGQHAIVSAMIAVRDDGNDVLWQSRIA